MEQPRFNIEIPIIQQLNHVPDRSQNSYDHTSLKWSHMTPEDIAADTGDLPLLKEYYEAGRKCTERGVYEAAANGYLEVVTFLLENDTPVSHEAIDFSTACGHLNVIEYLINKGVKGTACACDNAAKNGHVDMLELLYSNGYQCSNIGLHFAAVYKREDATKWLINHKAPFLIGTLTHAIQTCTSNMNIIDMLIDYGVPITSFAIEAAYEKGLVALADRLRKLKQETAHN